MPKFLFISVVTGVSLSRHLCAAEGSCWTACTEENVSLCSPFSCIEASDVGELHPFTWLIEEDTQYRLWEMKPDNKRCYTEKCRRLQSSAGPASHIQKKIWPNKWYQTFAEKSRKKQASVLPGSCVIRWATLKPIMICKEVTIQRSSWSWCSVAQNFAIKTAPHQSLS